MPFHDFEINNISPREEAKHAKHARAAILDYNDNGKQNACLHYNPKWRLAFFTSSLRLMSLIWKSWKTLNIYKHSLQNSEWQTNPSYAFFLKYLIAENFKIVGIGGLFILKNIKIFVFYRFFFPDHFHRSDFVHEIVIFFHHDCHDFYIVPGKELWNQSLDRDYSGHVSWILRIIFQSKIFTTKSNF